MFNIHILIYFHYFIAMKVYLCKEGHGALIYLLKLYWSVSACLRVCVRAFLTGQLLSCLWPDSADTLVDGRAMSWLVGALIIHQVALLEGCKRCFFSDVCGTI